MTDKGKASRKPLALGPADLDGAASGEVDFEQLRKLISRHLAAHLPILVDDAVASSVEPVADSLVENLRNAVLQRLEEERETFVDDILEELRRQSD